jgi:hypothetical protein
MKSKLPSQPLKGRYPDKCSENMAKAIAKDYCFMCLNDIFR